MPGMPRACSRSWSAGPISRFNQRSPRGRRACGETASVPRSETPSRASPWPRPRRRSAAARIERGGLDVGGEDFTVGGRGCPAGPQRWRPRRCRARPDRRFLQAEPGEASADDSVDRHEGGHGDDQAIARCVARAATPDVRRHDRLGRSIPAAEPAGEQGAGRAAGVRIMAPSSLHDRGGSAGGHRRVVLEGVDCAVRFG